MVFDIYGIQMLVVVMKWLKGVIIVTSHELFWLNFNDTVKSLI